MLERTRRGSSSHIFVTAHTSTLAHTLAPSSKMNARVSRGQLSGRSRANVTQKAPACRSRAGDRSSHDHAVGHCCDDSVDNSTGGRRKLDARNPC